MLNIKVQEAKKYHFLIDGFLPGSDGYWRALAVSDTN